jgi:hypothetical protein
MFIALRDGKFDAVVDGRADVSQATAKAPAPSPSPAKARANAAVAAPAPPAAAAAVDGEAPPTIRQPAPELALDMDALERAAAAAAAGTADHLRRQAGDLPPPPVNLFREKTAAAPSPSPVRRASHAGIGSPAERRYAPTRPASIFGQARPQQGKTIFGEDLISDKSLDEVILSYLSEDLNEDK